jgi:hypothetical protein
MTRFGDLIREARLQQEISLSRVAHRLTWEQGVTMSAADVSAVERGQCVALLTDLAVPMGEILSIAPDVLRFAAKHDAEATGSWGVARVLSFYDGPKGGWADMAYLVVAWCEDDRIVDGPYAVQADAERAASEMIARASDDHEKGATHDD